VTVRIRAAGMVRSVRRRPVASSFSTQWRPRFRPVVAHVGFLAAVVLAGAAFSWRDAIVLVGIGIAVQGATRRLLAAGAVLLFTVAFPPLSWPTYWFCLAPLVWIWREREPRASRAEDIRSVERLMRPKPSASADADASASFRGTPGSSGSLKDRGYERSLRRVALEGIAIGFAAAWLSTGFVRAAIPAWGWILHGAACVVFSLQFLGIALAIRLLRSQPVLLAAAVAAVAAVACEGLQAWCGIAW
jgi:hypothetical protein